MQNFHIKDSNKHGLGVFAITDIKQGEIIEKCAYIVIDDDDLKDDNRLNDYLFTSPDCNTDYLVMMGVGMLFNHGRPGNCDWEIDSTDNRFVLFKASCFIKSGEEILHDYGEEYWQTRDVETL
ncbi:MAG: SET domain-containing protein-lysine N-methyltransferase [Alphaproteobacteria bacterium]|nr:SET domain-containing protein-lysine N-methyltransferase [Alphaproteobacteria bacterium]